MASAAVKGGGGGVSLQAYHDTVAPIVVDKRVFEATTSIGEVKSVLFNIVKLNLM